MKKRQVLGIIGLAAAMVVTGCSGSSPAEKETARQAAAGKDGIRGSRQRGRGRG